MGMILTNKIKRVSNMSELKPCPFCGGVVGVKWSRMNDTMRSVGCVEQSMLCPNPCMVVYKGDNGEFDYTYWNRRVDNNK